jgi:hypothetical protein
MSLSVTPPLPSERKFGLLFATVFLLLAVWTGANGRTGSGVSLAVVAALFLALALVAPARLAPLNVLWFRFGLLLARVVSPVVLGVMFFGLITPVSLLTRLFGRDVLRLKNPSRETCWVERVPPGPARASFKNQF